MNRYANNQTKYTKSDSFAQRYAANMTTKNEAKIVNDKAEFEVDYAKGSVRIASAQKYMSLRTAGLDMFLEGDLSVVWKKEGDRIIRLDNDLSWVEQLLNEEGN